MGFKYVLSGTVIRLDGCASVPAFQGCHLLVISNVNPTLRLIYNKGQAYFDIHPVPPLLESRFPYRYLEKVAIGAVRVNVCSSVGWLVLQKPGKWCAMHVHIAWQIYHHQQKVKVSPFGGWTVSLKGPW